MGHELLICPLHQQVYFAIFDLHSEDVNKKMENSKNHESCALREMKSTLRIMSDEAKIKMSSCFHDVLDICRDCSNSGTFFF